MCYCSLLFVQFATTAGGVGCDMLVAAILHSQRNAELRMIKSSTDKQGRMHYLQGSMK